jgi:hypothetical protein
MRLHAADAADQASSAEQRSHVRERDLQLVNQSRAEFCSTDHRTGSGMARSAHDD